MIRARARLTAVGLALAPWAAAQAQPSTQGQATPAAQATPATQATAAPPAQDTPSAYVEVERALHGYYAEEKHEAFFFVAVGIVSAAAGGLLAATRSDDLSRGFGWATLGFGAAEVLGAGYYALAVDGKLADYGALLARDPVEFKRAESEHIHGTTSRFVLYQLLELAVVLGGAALAVYGFAKDKPTFEGAGIAIGAESAAVLVLDWFGGQRARRYEEQLQRFDPTVRF